jgi:hypothetical protein
MVSHRYVMEKGLGIGKIIGLVLVVWSYNFGKFIP